MNKFIYHFGKDGAEGNSGMSDILGGKGANLAQMANLGLPIPPGFTIATDICQTYYNKGNQLSKNFESEIDTAIKQLEQEIGKIFGSSNKPLLLSVRSGAKISMPGMMDTILNLGMNDEVAKGLAQETKNPRFALDSYRRFLEMYGSVVLEIPHYIFADRYENYKSDNNFTEDSQIPAEILKKVITDFKAIILKHSGREFETNPQKQLVSAIKAVLKSWMSPRALSYRKINNINDINGTAVNIQSMVFGNKGDNSATGVIFTRCPSSGNNQLFGEFLVNAQGEDVVAGIRTPTPILKTDDSNGNSMQEIMPGAFSKLSNFCNKLESYYSDMQDIEFTIEDSKLYILQTRSGKRSAAATIKIAVDLAQEGIISKQEALLRINPESLNQLLHTAIDYSTKPHIIATGLPASPGAATAIAVFSPREAEEMSHHHKVILIRNDTSPEDIKGMNVASGILTARGGMTSHAAVVARGMGRPCVCGVNGLAVNEKQKLLTTASGHTIRQGDTLTIDGSTGSIILGDIKLVEPEFSGEFNTILKWADEERRLGVRTNAETPVDADMAMKFGAEGIGLCRTEHMFFDVDKILLVRQMIIAQNADLRMQAIENLRPLQMQDFKKLFKILDGKPVNIRLLDPPLHEFLPTDRKDIKELAEQLDVPESIIDHRLQALHEANPMLGHRGCRLGISHPEIYMMQVEAILSAVHELYESDKIKSKLELMIPLISNTKELAKIKKYITSKVAEMNHKFNTVFHIKLGTMIELPRAALIADKIAPLVDYFSFGTNDLTQTTFGISRDDIGSFLPNYLEQKIFANDPFMVLDEEGVGNLIKIAIKKGRAANPDLTLGVCGEHAGNPTSIDFFHKVGIDYISCSPYRVPIARVAAAISKIKTSKSKNTS